MIKVIVPASSANFGSGTDCVGVALPLYLTVQFERADRMIVSYPNGDAPAAPESDWIVIAARKVYAMAGVSFPTLKITVTSQIPLCSGLGSSASAIVAGMCGANAMLGKPFTTEQLINAATEMEGHPDNVVPSFLGGFTVSMTHAGNVHCSAMPLDAQLMFIAVHPHYRLETKSAREVLPKEVALTTALAQLQRGCYLVSVMQRKAYDRLAAATDDQIFTPARRALVKGFDQVTKAAAQNGAYCAFISGAGPTIIALADRGAQCDRIAGAMQDAFTSQGLESTTYIMLADNSGVRIEEAEA